MGGEITVRSALGQGTRFRVRLMLASVTRPAPATIPAVAANPPDRRYAGACRVVLVADDDPAHRALMREILEPLGLVVREAESGPDCLAKAEGIDLLLLDIAMPGMSGWTVAKTLREAGHTGPIAIMSANVHEISPVRGGDAPHDAIIAKPFDLRDLLARVTSLLGLEWTESAHLQHLAPAPENVVASGPAAASAVPDREQIGELLRLGRIGHVRGIEAKLAQLEDEAAASPAFVAEMRGLIASYDLRRYLSVLQGLSRDG
jgi:CheY-like chemotaxis protein